MFKWFVIASLSLSLFLNAELKVLTFAGSAREDSLNKKLVKVATELAQQMGGTVTYIDLKEYPLPIYDGDLEKDLGMPENAKKLRKLFIDNQVIIIASPEYNRSISPMLKNLIDWVSRSETNGSSRDAYKGKKFLLLGASPGGTGAARGLEHLRQILSEIGGTVAKRQFTLPNATNAFDKQGRLKDPKLKEQLQQAVLEALQ